MLILQEKKTKEWLCYAWRIGKNTLMSTMFLFQHLDKFDDK